MSRSETRIERYLNKSENAIQLPLELAAINFHCDENLAFLIRTAACFGVQKIHVIGSIPARKTLYNASGSLVDFVDLRQYSNPSNFLKYVRENEIKLISAEIAENSYNLFEYDFNFKQKTVIILGNESIGIPSEILMNSEIIHIPMWGLGFCLNTSQTGTAFVSEYCRQYFRRKIID